MNLAEELQQLAKELFKNPDNTGYALKLQTLANRVALVENTIASYGNRNNSSENQDEDTN